MMLVIPLTKSTMDYVKEVKNKSGKLNNRTDRDKQQESPKVYKRCGKDFSNAQALIWRAFEHKQPI